MRMKVLILSLICFCLTEVVRADGNNTVSLQELPEPAQIFLDTYFDEVTYTSIIHKEENEYYQLETTNKWRFTFGDEGNWIDIDCNQNRVPSPIVPSPILNSIARKFGPTTYVVKITITRRGVYMIKLSNCIRLGFDKRFKLMKFDHK